MAVRYLRATIVHDGKRWAADVSINGQRQREAPPTLVVQRLANIGFEFVSATLSRTFVPMDGTSAHPVAWMKAKREVLAEVKLLDVMMGRPWPRFRRLEGEGFAVIADGGVGAGQISEITGPLWRRCGGGSM